MIQDLILLQKKYSANCRYNPIGNASHDVL